MIDGKLYSEYLDCLLAGDRGGCTNLVRQLLETRTPIKEIYTDLFQRSLYEVGELWESNRISVAVEHLATSITEYLLSLIYPTLITGHEGGPKAIISCTANEYHQLGGKIVADMMEVLGWNTYFLGANTPISDLVSMIEERRPELVGLSLAVYFNLDGLLRTLDEVREAFRELPIFVGGQAFRWGGQEVLEQWSGVEYVSSLDDLEIKLDQGFGTPISNGEGI